MSDHSLIKPSHKAIRHYYETLADYKAQNVTHEIAVRTAFQNLLAKTAKDHRRLLVPVQSARTGGKRVVPDGTLRELAPGLLRGHEHGQ